jgi:hypothetical protein
LQECGFSKGLLNLLHGESFTSFWKTFRKGFENPSAVPFSVLKHGRLGDLRAAELLLKNLQAQCGKPIAYWNTIRRRFKLPNWLPPNQSQPLKWGQLVSEAEIIERGQFARESTAADLSFDSC